MLNWFKRKKSILNYWEFEDLQGFKMIKNSDSIQYINETSSKTIYFSVLHVTGGGVLNGKTSKPVIVETESGWQLKGTNNANDKLLICVISVIDKDDIKWAETFFESIKPSS